MKPPQEAETDKLWKLKTTVYGLCDAPRVWYISVKGVLVKAGAVKSKFDDSVSYWQKDGKLEELISCHVDDSFWAGTKSFEISVIDMLKNSFVTSQEELRSFKYVGLNIEQRQGCIYLDQLMYTDELKEVDVSRERMSKESPLTTEEARQLRGLAEKLDCTSSFIIFLCKSDKNYAPILWKSRKIQQVAGLAVSGV